MTAGVAGNSECSNLISSFGSRTVWAVTRKFSGSQMKALSRGQD